VEVRNAKGESGEKIENPEKVLDELDCQNLLGRNQEGESTGTFWKIRVLGA
jgi:hypothetical protein